MRQSKVKVKKKEASTEEVEAKVAPLTIDFNGLGEEKLAMVAAKVNEIIERI